MTTELEKFLEHHGVKGMKWGVRKNRSASDRMTKKIAKADVKFEKKSTGIRGENKVIAGYSKAVRKGTQDWTKTPEFQSLNKKWSGKYFTPGYDRAMAVGFSNYLNKNVLPTIEGSTNASGTRKMQVIPKGQDDWTVVTVDVKHADLSVTLRVTRDSTGQIVGFDLIDPVSHEDNESALIHFGVKGMKWGQRKNRKGPASPDFSRKADIKSKAKAGGGVRALSNKELQDAINRMNLEQNFKRLKANEHPLAVRFLATTLQEVGKQQVRNLVVAKVSGKK